MYQRAVGWCETVQEETELTLEYPSEQSGISCGIWVCKSRTIS